MWFQLQARVQQSRKHRSRSRAHAIKRNLGKRTLKEAVYIKGIVKNPNNPAVESDPWESCRMSVVNKPWSLWSTINTKHWAGNRSCTALQYHIIRESWKRRKEQKKQMITDKKLWSLNETKGRGRRSVTLDTASPCFDGMCSCRQGDSKAPSSFTCPPPSTKVMNTVFSRSLICRKMLARSASLHFNMCKHRISSSASITSMRRCVCVASFLLHQIKVSSGNRCMCSTSTRVMQRHKWFVSIHKVWSPSPDK